VRFLELSPWIGRPADATGPLAEDLRADVAVVGAGYTGLSTALALRSEGLDVAVLEQDFAGAGASGSNAGHLTPTIGKDLPSLLRLYGRERAAALVQLADRAVEYTESLIEKHRIDCDYHRSGNLLAAVHARQLPRLERAARAGRELGARVRFLPGTALRERGVPPAFVGGVLEECGGTLDPGRYVLGLRRAALDAGVRLFEASPVVRVEDGARPLVRTRSGSVSADRVVLATNAYTPLLSFLSGADQRRVIPLRVTLFETEPLDEAERSALGWPGREGIYTAHESLENYRLTARGSVVGGSKLPRYAYGSALAPGEHPKSFAVNEARFRERFPALRERPIAHFWGGWIAYPLDFLPSLGTMGESGRIFSGLGYAGHGVAQASLMGPMLADLVLGRKHGAAAALERRAWRWPPEPLRWLAWSATFGALDLLDRRIDRLARQ
jgi:gamma-glutamylputrescine oxidase